MLCSRTRLFAPLTTNCRAFYSSPPPFQPSSLTFHLRFRPLSFLLACAFSFSLLSFSLSVRHGVSHPRSHGSCFFFPLRPRRSNDSNLERALRRRGSFVEKPFSSFLSSSDFMRCINVAQARSKLTTVFGGKKDARTYKLNAGGKKERAEERKLPEENRERRV